MEGQDIAFPGKGQRPKDAHRRFDAPPGQSQVLLDRVQGTPDQSLGLVGENAEAVFMRINGELALLRLLKDMDVSLFGFEMRAELGRLGQKREDPVEFRLTHAHVEHGAAALRGRGAAFAFVVDRTDRLQVQTRGLGAAASPRATALSGRLIHFFAFFRDALPPTQPFLSTITAPSGGWVLPVVDSQS